MKIHLHYKLLNILVFFIFTLNTQLVCINAQSCNALIPPTTINGINVTATSTGSVTSYPTAYTSCGVYTTHANSVWLGYGFTYTLNFSAPVNCLNFILTATGGGSNEDFTFTTNTGTPSITDNGSCFTTITGNTILSGAGANSTGGGGGDFTIVNPLPFTSLTISGAGLENGSLFAICNSSINSSVFNDLVASICIGDSILIDGAFRTTAGTYSDTIIGGSYCGSDSIVRTNLSINPLPSPTINTVTDQCESTDSVTLIGVPTGGIFSGIGVSGTNFNPSIAGTGTHTITYDYTDTNGCSGSSTTDITVISAPPLVIDSIPDLCVNGAPVTLIGNPSGGTFSGAGISGNSFDPAVAGIGVHTLNYEYTYANGCIANQQFEVNVIELLIPTFSGDELFGCKNHTVMFTDNTGLSGENCTWDFGDGTTSNACDSVSHTYTAGGFYDVTLTLESAEGCIGTTTLTDYVEVLSGPTASFIANPTITDYNNTEVHFTNQSVNATNYIWDFGDFSAQVFETHPIHDFQNGVTGNYSVTLYAIDDLGCIDSVSIMIQVLFPDMKYDIPNVFTPNADGENDFFKIINPENVFGLEVIILNRWGNLVFESNDVNFKWNGQKHNDGAECTDGTYFYKMKLKNNVGEEVEEHGFIHLSRGE